MNKKFIRRLILGSTILLSISCGCLMPSQELSTISYVNTSNNQVEFHNNNGVRKASPSALQLASIGYSFISYPLTCTTGSYLFNGVVASGSQNINVLIYKNTTKYIFFTTNAESPKYYAMTSNDTTGNPDWNGIDCNGWTSSNLSVCTPQSVSQLTLVDGKITFNYSDHNNVDSTYYLGATGFTTDSNSALSVDISASGYSLSFTNGSSNYTYTGSQITPSVTLTNPNGTALVKDIDYTVTNSNTNGIPGTYTLTISGKGTYSGSKTINYTIDKKSVSGLSLSVDTATYSGSALTPNTTLKFGNVTLTKGTDYGVSYSNNTNAGTGTVTITGKGNRFTGTKTQNFTINQLSMTNNASFSGTLSGTDFTYTGAAITPSVTEVKYGSRTLVLGTDYTISYSNNVSAGTGKVTISGKGNFKGSFTKDFTIAQKDASGFDVTVDDSACVYTGTTGVKPVITIKDGTKTLVEGTDYDVTYTNNKTTGTDVATATITYKGNYSGEKSENYSINKLDLTGKAVAVTLDQTSYTYTGSEIKPNVTKVRINDSFDLDPADYDIAYTDNVVAGTGTMTFTAKGNCSGTFTKTFTIDKKDVSGLTVEVDPITYTGSEVEPSFKVKYGDIVLTPNVDYTYDYSNNIEAGTAAVISITGTGNYTGTKDTNFTISPLEFASDNLEVDIDPDTYTYSGSENKPTVNSVKCKGVTLVEGIDYSISYEENTNAGEGKVVITGLGNYGGTYKKKFTINSKPLTADAITLDTTSFVYNNDEKKPTATVKDGDATLVEGTDYEISYTNNKNTGTATATIKGINNYQGSFDKSFTITPKDIDFSGISVADVTYNGQSQDPTIVLYDGTKLLVKGVDYKIVSSNNVNVGEASTVITGINNYQGTTNLNFNINAHSILSDEVKLSYDSVVYNGSAYEPTSTVVCNGNTLVLGRDYTISYSNNTEAGIASAIITGINNYAGTAVKPFTIEPKPISDMRISVADATYDGTAKTPSVSVYYGGLKLVEGVDYVLNYNNNINALDDSYVTVTGIGNFKGQVDRDFAIYKADYQIDVDTSDISIDCFTNEKLDIKNYSGRKAIITSSDPNIVSVDENGNLVPGTTVGPVTITVEIPGDDNHNSYTATINVTSVLNKGFYVGDISDPTNNKVYKDIDEAIKAVDPGTTIYYVGDILVDKSIEVTKDISLVKDPTSGGSLTKAPGFEGDILSPDEGVTVGSDGLNEADVDEVNKFIDKYPIIDEGFNDIDAGDNSDSLDNLIDDYEKNLTSDQKTIIKKKAKDLGYTSDESFLTDLINKAKFEDEKAKAIENLKNSVRSHDGKVTNKYLEKAIAELEALTYDSKTSTDEANKELETKVETIKATESKFDLILEYSRKLEKIANNLEENYKNDTGEKNADTDKTVSDAVDKILNLDLSGDSVDIDENALTSANEISENATKEVENIRAGINASRAAAALETTITIMLFIIFILFLFWFIIVFVKRRNEEYEVDFTFERRNDK